MQISKKSVSNRDGAEDFYVFWGPLRQWNAKNPPRNGGRTASKDIFLPIQRPCKLSSEAKGGWDTHRIAGGTSKLKRNLASRTRILEKNLNWGIQPQSGKERSCDSKNEWDDLTEKIGYWVDLDDPYITFLSQSTSSHFGVCSSDLHKGLFIRAILYSLILQRQGRVVFARTHQPGTYKDVTRTFDPSAV